MICTCKPPSLPPGNVDLLPRYKGTLIPPPTAIYPLHPASPSTFPIVSSLPFGALKLCQSGMGEPSSVALKGAPVIAMMRSVWKRSVGPACMYIHSSVMSCTTCTHQLCHASHALISHAMHHMHSSVMSCITCSPSLDAMTISLLWQLTTACCCCFARFAASLACCFVPRQCTLIVVLIKY